MMGTKNFPWISFDNSKAPATLPPKILPIGRLEKNTVKMRQGFSDIEISKGILHTKLTFRCLQNPNKRFSPF